MNNLDKIYTDLLQDILDNGVQKGDRTGTGTISVFGRQIRHKMSEGFPLLTTKKMAWKTMVVELLWFLRGDTNIKFLVDNGCSIWNGDAFKNYISKTNEYKGDWPDTMDEFIERIKTDDEFAEKWGELGPIYGKQWRKWQGWMDMPNVGMYAKGSLWYDQIGRLIHQLKTNPDSRRLMVNAWNVGELDQMVLPPCHYGFQVYTRELSLEERVRYYETTFGRLHFIPPSPDALDARNIPTRAISLMWNQRSVDTFLGLPFNIASYGLLLEIIAKAVNMVPDELIGNLGDVHLYSNHIEQAKEQIGRKYEPDERSEMLKESMGYENYHNAIEELMPFGGGLSEYYNAHNIPYHTRESYKLPTLRICSGQLDDIAHHEINDFDLLNYQSHPSIKAPLSN
jgi:thymidylate synthase